MVYTPELARRASKNVVCFDLLPNMSYSKYWRMEVRVLIDGNNLLYAARALAESGPLLGRSMLCKALGQWARRRGERVHVVFDGPAPGRGLAEQIGDPDIDVSYSGDRTADAELIALLEADSAARRALVVSSDREIGRAARRQRAHGMRAEDFWARLQRDLSRPSPQPVEPKEKQRGLAPDVAEEWMREFGFTSTDGSSLEDGAA
jgi:predicted RNA-binding protein with PIN domain